MENEKRKNIFDEIREEIGEPMITPIIDSKAFRFVGNKLIQEYHGFYVVNHLKRNKKDYIVNFKDDDTLVCDCQGCNTNDYCSHVLGIMIHRYIKNKDMNELRIYCNEARIIFNR